MLAGTNESIEIDVFRKWGARGVLRTSLKITDVARYGHMYIYAVYPYSSRHPMTIESCTNMCNGIDFLVTEFLK